MSEETQPEVKSEESTKTTNGIKFPYEPDATRLKTLDDILTFIELDEEQKNRQKVMFEAGRKMIRAVLSNVRPGQNQGNVIQMICQAVSVANQSIQIEK